MPKNERKYKTIREKETSNFFQNGHQQLSYHPKVEFKIWVWSVSDCCNSLLLTWCSYESELVYRYEGYHLASDIFIECATQLVYKKFHEKKYCFVAERGETQYDAT